MTYYVRHRVREHTKEQPYQRILRRAGQQWVWDANQHIVHPIDVTLVLQRRLIDHEG